MRSCSIKSSSLFLLKAFASTSKDFSFAGAAVPHVEALDIAEKLSRKQKERVEADTPSGSEEEDLLRDPGELPSTSHRSVSESGSSGFKGFLMPSIPDDDNNDDDDDDDDNNDDDDDNNDDDDY